MKGRSAKDEKSGFCCCVTPLHLKKNGHSCELKSTIFGSGVGGWVGEGVSLLPRYSYMCEKYENFF